MRGVHKWIRAKIFPRTKKMYGGVESDSKVFGGVKMTVNVQDYAVNAIPGSITFAQQHSTRSMLHMPERFPGPPHLVTVIQTPPTIAASWRQNLPFYQSNLLPIVSPSWRPTSTISVSEVPDTGAPSWSSRHLTIASQGPRGKSWLIVVSCSLCQFMNTISLVMAIYGQLFV